jgi:hypothetical protein
VTELPRHTSPRTDRRTLPFRFAVLPPWLFPAIAVSWIVLCLLALWLVDIRGALGGPERLQEAGLDPAYLWFQLFMDGGFTEWFQWALLGVLIVLASGLAVAHRQQEAAPGDLSDELHERMAAFWTLVALLAVVMLIEDAGNPRHLINHYVGVATGFSNRATTAAELVYFAAIGAIGLYALLRHGRALLPGGGSGRDPDGRRRDDDAEPRTGAAGSLHYRRFGALGIVMYATAAVSSATRNIGDWYIDVGRWLIDDVLGAPQLVRAVPVEGLDEWDLRFMFVDFVLEESLELLGVALLVAAVLAYTRTGPHLDPRRERTPS